jgi:hypothetical protein
MTPRDDEGFEQRWEDLPFDVRAELEGVGITEALFNGRVDDPQALEEALRRVEAHNRAEEAAMPPQVRKTYRKVLRRELQRAIDNDAFLDGLEYDLDRRGDHPER